MPTAPGCAPAFLFRAAGTTARAASTRWHGISGTVSPSIRPCATRSLHPASRTILQASPCWAANLLSRKTSGSCCPLSATSGRCTRQDGVVLFRLHLGTAYRQRSLPRALRGHRRATEHCWMFWWTAALCKPSTTSPCASAAAPTSAFWMCPSPLPQGARLVGGRTGVRHTYHGTVSGAELLLVKIRLSRPALKEADSAQSVQRLLAF